MTNNEENEDLSSIEGKVANIIDKYRVVINKGSEDGIYIGQKFLILTIGNELFDPDTDESLGKVEIIKGKGEVSHVQPRMATLQTIETHEIRRTPALRAAFSVFSDAVVEEKPKAFIDPEIGDIAREI